MTKYITKTLPVDIIGRHQLFNLLYLVVPDMEVVFSPLLDILKQNIHMLLPVGPVVLVEEAQAVHDLVSDDLHGLAEARREVDHLLSALFAYKRPAALVGVVLISVDGEPGGYRSFVIVSLSSLPDPGVDMTVGIL